jgi:hypothetical protein
MSLIIPANTLASGGFAVDNSCRFNSGSSDSLTRTLGTPTNNKIWTYSFWVKQCSNIGNVLNTGSDTAYIYFRPNDADPAPSGFSIEQYVGDFQYRIIPNMVFRDPSAWRHIVIAFDTTQGTDTNRVKVYNNGTQITSFNTATYPSQNLDTQVNSAVSHKIGGLTGGTSQNLDGYLSEVCFIDGQQLDPTSFGEFDEDSGIWKPIDVSGLTFGTNGFYLDFEDSAALGDDVSGNGNDFTVNNLTAIDQTTDTPTNNFCTLNPLVYSTGLTFSEGNCKLVTAGSSTSGGVGTMGMPSGKWYYEVKLGGDIDNHTHGIISEFTNTNQSGLQNKVGVTSWINGDGGEVVVDGTATTADYGLYTINQIMGIAVDVDNSTISYYRDGSALVTGYTISTTRGTLFPFIKMGLSTTAEVNFGNPAFTISSGNTDGNGYGNFEYEVPSGYLSLCTANLSEVLG